MMDVFDIADDRYAAQVMPELYIERQPVLANWSEEDREMYCGEYTSARRLALKTNWTDEDWEAFCDQYDGVHTPGIPAGPTDADLRALGGQPLSLDDVADTTNDPFSTQLTIMSLRNEWVG